MWVCGDVGSIAAVIRASAANWRPPLKLPDVPRTKASNRIFFFPQWLDVTQPAAKTAATHPAREIRGQPVTNRVAKPDRPLSFPLLVIDFHRVGFANEKTASDAAVRTPEIRLGKIVAGPETWLSVLLTFSVAKLSVNESRSYWPKVQR